MSKEKFYRVLLAVIFLSQSTLGAAFAQTTCGTCIKSREQEGSQMCPISTMKDMYEIIKESDRVVAF